MCANQQHYHMENHVTQASLSDLFTYPPGAGSIHMLRYTGSAVVIIRSLWTAVFCFESGDGFVGLLVGRGLGPSRCCLFEPLLLLLLLWYITTTVQKKERKTERKKKRKKERKKERKRHVISCHIISRHVI